MPRRKEQMPIVSEVDERAEKIKEIILRLRGDLKQLFTENIMVIDAREWEDASADIVVIIKPSTDNINEVRDFLKTESDFVITNEGPSPILNKEDQAFYLKLKE